MASGAYFDIKLNLLLLTIEASIIDAPPGLEPRTQESKSCVLTSYTKGQ